MPLYYDNLLVMLNKKEAVCIKPLLFRRYASSDVTYKLLVTSSVDKFPLIYHPANRWFAHTYQYL